MDPDLFIPIIEHQCFPEKIRNFFRFGVPERSFDSKQRNDKLLEDDDDYHISPAVSDSDFIIRTTVI